MQPSYAGVCRATGPGNAARSAALGGKPPPAARRRGGRERAPCRRGARPRRVPRHRRAGARPRLAPHWNLAIEKVPVKARRQRIAQHETRPRGRQPVRKEAGRAARQAACRRAIVPPAAGAPRRAHIIPPSSIQSGIGQPTRAIPRRAGGRRTQVRLERPLAGRGAGKVQAIVGMDRIRPEREARRAPRKAIMAGPAARNACRTWYSPPSRRPARQDRPMPRSRRRAGSIAFPTSAPRAADRGGCSGERARVRPFIAATSAAVMPDAPDPMTTRSNSAS